MLASLLIVFREVFEAGLIIGIVLAATEGLAGRMKWILGGIAVGVLSAGVLAIFAGEISNALAGNGQEVFNACILLLALMMLAWHSFWMASHGRELSRQIKVLGAQVHDGQKSLFAMATVVCVAVLREGVEVVLFLYGVVISSTEGPLMLIAGGIAGLLLGALVAFLLYRGLLIIPAKSLFSVTEGLLTVLAAGLAGQAFAILAGTGLLPTLGDQIWDTSWILRDDTLLGRALHALVGYSDRPPGIQVIAYVVTLALFMIGMKVTRQKPSSNSKLKVEKA